MIAALTVTTRRVTVEVQLYRYQPSYSLSLRLSRAFVRYKSGNTLGVNFKRSYQNSLGFLNYFSAETNRHHTILANSVSAKSSIIGTNKMKRKGKTEDKESSSGGNVGAESPVRSPGKGNKKKVKTDHPLDIMSIENSLNADGKMVADIINPRLLPPGVSTCKIISWNVAGIRGLLKKNPDIIAQLIEKNDPDILCLQETKLQTDAVDEIKRTLMESLSKHGDYASYWSCSRVKLGYSGTMVLVKGPSSIKEEPKPKQAKLTSLWGGGKSSDGKKNANKTSSSQAASSKLTVLSVHYDGELPPEIAGGSGASRLCPGEGRTITVEFPNFFLVNCYVPNSGQDLVRLDYRINTWDPAMRQYLDTLQQHKPVIFAGDLNVGHLDLDIHNPGAKHIVKQAGLTPQERASFTTLLESGSQSRDGVTTSGFIDALRWCYPHARGLFSYWSQRTFARPVNKGIRLDYFICSRSFVSPYEHMAASSQCSHQSLSTEEEQRVLEELKQTPGNPVEPRSIVDYVLERAGKDDTKTLTELSSAAVSPLLMDSYTLPFDTVGCSDHGPVALIMGI